MTNINGWSGEARAICCVASFISKVGVELLQGEGESFVQRFRILKKITGYPEPCSTALHMMGQQ